MENIYGPEMRVYIERNVFENGVEGFGMNGKRKNFTIRFV